MIEKLSEKLSGDLDGQSLDINDSAHLARDAWRALGPAANDPSLLAESLLQSHGGRNVAALGLQDDLGDAARIDRFDVVPQLDLATMYITGA